MLRQANEDMKHTVAINKKIISEILSAESSSSGSKNLEVLIKEHLWALELNLEKVTAERD
jgi:hypothetical protein